MTYLFAPEDEFHSESHDIHIWARHIEFALGYFATRPPTEVHDLVTGWTLEEFKQLMDQYYLSVDTDRFLNRDRDNPKPFALASASIHSMHVRGDAYPDQFKSYARDLYTPHDQWFLSNLGFTIDNAISVAEGIINQLNERFKLAIVDSKVAAETLVKADLSWQSSGLSFEDAVQAARVKLSFGAAKTIFRFTVDEIAGASGVPLAQCYAVLARLSQARPYCNSLFPATFENPASAPWDYNTISERPIIREGGGYWAVVPFLLLQNIYYTFFFDLMADHSYKPTFEASRGKFLEEKVSEYARRVFPTNAVLLNPTYLNGDEFSDVLVLFDGKIIVFQCKSNALTRAAHIGENADALKSDFQKAIRDAVDQGVRCKEYLESAAQIRLRYRNADLSIDMRHTNEVHIVAVTLMPLQSMATRIKEVEDDLGLVHSTSNAWALSLGDFDVVTEVCDSPARLLHYIRRRLLLEDSAVRVHGDEMDLLGFYLDQGLWLKDECFDGANLIAVSGYSDSIDEYVFMTRMAKSPADKPRVQRPEGFYRLVDGTESLQQWHRTDCAITLLDLSGSASVNLMNAYSAMRAQTVQDRKFHTFSFEGNDDAPGLSFAFLSSQFSLRDFEIRTEGFGTIKKYATRSKQWAAFGWYEASRNEVAGAIWLDFHWEQDPKLDEVSKQLVRGKPMTQD